MRKQIHSQLAPFASNSSLSRGRFHTETNGEASERTDFQRDRDRIVHSGAFRRLHNKTQVFVCHDGENYRTRLTHSLEAAQIARAVARSLHLDEDLAEALALAHDLGHPPFGHAGEDALQKCLEDYGGFDHNAQSLRIVTKLERRYFAFDGLNLTWECLEGLAKHNGPLLGGPLLEGPLLEGSLPDVSQNMRLPLAIKEYAALHDLELFSFAGPEAQAAALADDIAYNAHDLDDGLRAGLFKIETLREAPFVGPMLRTLEHDHPEAEPSRLAYEMVRRLITAMVADLLAETRRRLAEDKPDRVEAVRANHRALVAFSPEMLEHDHSLKDFLFSNMYRHFRVNRMTSKARRVVRDLFTLFLAEPRCLPPDWQQECDEPKGMKTARCVADYIAGMTDRFALEEHRRLFDISVKP